MSVTIDAETGVTRARRPEPRELVWPSRSQSRLRWLPPAQLAFYVALAVLVGVAVAQSQAFSTELADHPDEAAHFVTGVMVYDYLTTALGASPTPYAMEYYAH